MSKKYPKQLSLRDLEIAKFIAEQGAIRSTMINDLIQIKQSNTLEPRAVRALAQRLVNHNLAYKERILLGPAILWPTSSAIRLAGFKLKAGERVSKPSLATLLHTLAVSRVRILYERERVIWICERALRESSPLHLPDGMAFFGEKRHLVEVELTAKESTRVQTIMLLNLDSDVEQVDYWTNAETFNVVNKAKDSLPKNLSERVLVRLLPEEVYK